MKKSFILIASLFVSFAGISQQWSGLNDQTSGISRTGSVGTGALTANGIVTVSGFGNYLSVSSRYSGGNNGNILFQNGSGQNLILAETAADNWTLGYGLSAGSAPTQVISWNTAKTTTFAGNVAINGTGSYLSLTSRYNGGNNGTILFSNGTNQNLILAETASDNWAIGYGAAAGNAVTPVISWNASKNTTFSGSVGIGTSDPGSFKLAVNGKIWSQEVNVAMTNPGPDYVFEKDYNLLSLSEVERYINENKHLPEIPSAKEMEKDGLNLKEMNLLLLKKVEELTLHLIEVNKENAVLKTKVSEIEDLKMEIEQIKRNLK